MVLLFLILDEMPIDKARRVTLSLIDKITSDFVENLFFESLRQVSDVVFLTLYSFIEDIRERVLLNVKVI